MPSFGAEYNTILANLAALYDLRQERIEVVKINRRIDQVGSLIRHPLVQDSTGVIHSLNTATGTYVPVSVLPLAELPDVAHYQNGAMVSVGGVLYVKKDGAWSDFSRAYKWSIPRKGLILNGTSQYVKIPNGSAINVEAGNFTIEHVFELASVPTVTRWILAKGGGSAAPGYGILISNQGTGSLVLNLQDVTCSQTWLIAPAGSIVANTMYHLIISVDRAGDAVCYLNGTEVGRATVSAVSGDLTSTQPLVLGGFSTGGDLTAQKIYHTRLLNFNLLLSDVISLWNNGKPWESVIDYEDGVVFETIAYGKNCVFDGTREGNHGNVLPTPAVSLEAGTAQEYRDGTRARSSNWAPEGIIPAGYLVKRIIFHNTSASSCTINVGSTTSGGTDVVNGAVVAGGAIVTAEVNKLFSFTASQNLYFESSSWQTTNIHIIMEKQ